MREQSIHLQAAESSKEPMNILCTETGVDRQPSRPPTALNARSDQKKPDIDIIAAGEPSLPKSVLIIIITEKDRPHPASVLTRVAQHPDWSSGDSASVCIWPGAVNKDPPYQTDRRETPVSE
jgi:hypothetical protein